MDEKQQCIQTLEHPLTTISEDSNPFIPQKDLEALKTTLSPFDPSAPAGDQNNPRQFFTPWPLSRIHQHPFDTTDPETAEEVEASNNQLDSTITWADGKSQRPRSDRLGASSPASAMSSMDGLGRAYTRNGTPKTKKR